VIWHQKGKPFWILLEQEVLGWQIESEWLNVSLLVQTHVVLDKEPFLLRDAVLAQCPSVSLSVHHKSLFY